MTGCSVASISRGFYSFEIFRPHEVNSSGAMALWLSVRTHNTGVVSSITPCVTFKTPLARKAAGNHLMNSTSLEQTHSPISGFCYARNRVCNAEVNSDFSTLHHFHKGGFILEPLLF